MRKTRRDVRREEEREAYVEFVEFVELAVYCVVL